MWKLRRYFRQSLVGLFTVALLATMFSAVIAGHASATPSWSTGDKWALVGEKNVGQVYDSLEDYIFSGLNSSSEANNITIKQSSFYGKIMMGAIFEVTGSDATTISVKISVACNITISARLTINGDFPVAGTYYAYHYYPPGPATYPYLDEAPTTNRDMDQNAKMVAAIHGTIDVVLNKTNMGIRSYNANVDSYVKGYYALTNYPMMEYWYSSGPTKVNVTYESFTASVDVSATTGMQLTASPEVLAITDTMAVGDIMFTTSNITASETLSGSIVFAGLPNDITEQYFTSEMARTGITGFPINLAKIYNPDYAQSGGMPINNGTIASSSGHISLQSAYLRDRTINDPVSGSINVKEFAFRDYSAFNYTTFLYNPTNGHVVGTESTIPMGDAQVIFTTHSAPVGSTQEEINTMEKQVTDKQTYSAVTGESTTDDSSFGLDQNIAIILVIVVVVIAVIVGVVVLRKRK